MSFARRLLAVTVGSLTAATIALAGPAHAGSVSAEDAAGDAPRYLDVAGLTVTNGERRLTARVDLQRLERQRTSVYAVVSGVGRRSDDLFFVGWTQVRGERPGRVFAQLTADGVERRQCAGVRIRVSPQRLAVSVPQRCLGAAAGTLKVGVLTERRDGRDADEVGPFRVRRD